MKKIILLVYIIALSSFLQAQKQDLKEKIEQTILDKTSTQAKVIKIKPLNIKNVHIANIEINGNQIPLFVSGDGATIWGVPEIFFSTNNKILEETKQAVADTQTYNSRGKQQKLINTFKDKKDLAVFLSSTGKKTKKVTYIVSDPNCPYCKDEMQRIDDILSNSNVRFIFVGIIGGANSMLKSSDIIENAKKISLLKIGKIIQEKRILSHIKEVYFNSDYKPNSTSSVTAQESSQLAVQAGINAVPYKFIVEE